MSRLSLCQSTAIGCVRFGPLLEQTLQAGRIGAGAAGQIIGQQGLAHGFAFLADFCQVSEELIEQIFRRQAAGLAGVLPEPVGKVEKGSKW